jgi:hypothetical protein
MKKKLTQKELKRQLHYNPDTGIFTRLVSNHGKVKIGDIAGCICNTTGYVLIVINGEQYRAHRLAWLYIKGYFPEHDIDHKFGVRDDNRWSEINHVTRICNMQNTKLYNNNKSGFPGVCWHKLINKWASRITVNKKQVGLGYYNSPLEAALARFTFEVQCSKWKCNYRGRLVKAIKTAWPEFKIIY